MAGLGLELTRNDSSSRWIVVGIKNGSGGVVIGDALLSIRDRERSDDFVDLLDLTGDQVQLLLT